MKLPRRKFLHLAAGAAALSAISRTAFPQDYPKRPVRVVIPFAAGSAADIHGRFLQKRFSQPFTVENRPGGSGNEGAAEVLQSNPDGHTLLVITESHAINAGLYDNLTYNLIRDAAPIASRYRSGCVMVAHPGLPVGSVPEFISYAKANPGSITMGSLGTGSIGHLAGEMFKSMTGIDMMHVPYQTEMDAMLALFGGQTQVQFATPAVPIQAHRRGSLRILAVASTARLPVLPDVPAIAEYVPGYAAEEWLGLVGPKNMPAEIVTLLNKEINAEPGWKALYDVLGFRVFAATPGEFGEYIAAEVAKWTKVIKSAGVKAQ